MVVEDRDVESVIRIVSDTTIPGQLRVRLHVDGFVACLSSGAKDKCRHIRLTCWAKVSGDAVGRVGVCRVLMLAMTNCTLYRFIF